MTEEETKAQRGEMTKPLRGLEFKSRTLQKGPDQGEGPEEIYLQRCGICDIF